MLSLSGMLANVSPLPGNSLGFEHSIETITKFKKNVKKRKSSKKEEVEKSANNDSLAITTCTLSDGPCRYPQV